MEQVETGVQHEPLERAPRPVVLKKSVGIRSDQDATITELSEDYAEGNYSRMLREVIDEGLRVVISDVRRRRAD